MADKELNIPGFVRDTVPLLSVDPGSIVANQHLSLVASSPMGRLMPSQSATDAVVFYRQRMFALVLCFYQVSVDSDFRFACVCEGVSH